MYTTAHHLFRSSARLIQSHILPSIFFKPNINIIIPSVSTSSKWTLSFRFSRQNVVWIYLLPHPCHMPRSSYSSRLKHPNSIQRDLQILKLLIMQFSQSSGYFTPLRSKHFLHYSILEHPQPIFSLSVTDQVSQPYKTTGKIIVMCILIVICLCRQKEDKNAGPNGSKHCSNFNLFTIFNACDFDLLVSFSNTRTL